MELQVIISLVTVIGAGISVYVGVRVALAEIRRDLRALETADAQLERTVAREFSDIRDRVQRLEDTYFRGTREHN